MSNRRRPTGRRGGGGRGSGRANPGGLARGFAPSPTYPPASPPSSPPARTQRPAVATPSAAPSPASEAGSSSSAASLATEMEKKLTLVPAALPLSSAKAVSFPVRRDCGTLGKKVQVRANHFLVQIADRDLHHYDVSFSPEVVLKKTKRDVINKLVKMYAESHLGKRMPAYDGAKSIYTAGPLPFTSEEFLVKLADREDWAKRGKYKEFKVSIKLANKPDLNKLQQFLLRKHHETPQETIQALDVVLRAAPSQRYSVFGRSFFDFYLGRKGDLGSGLEYWRGFYQSLRPTQFGLSLNIDISARAFYEPILVSEFVEKHFGYPMHLSDDYSLKLDKNLKGVKVAPTYGCNMIHRINGVTLQPLSELTFTLKDKQTKVSVVQYYHEKYGINLKLLALPALQSGNDARPLYLPMELCLIIPGQRYIRKLSEMQVTNMLKATCQRPMERKSNIEQMLNQNNYKGVHLVNHEFGIQVNEEMTLVDARVLPPPTLKYQDKLFTPRMGAWNMNYKKVANGASVDFWACVNFSGLNPGLQACFLNYLVSVCVTNGVAFQPKPLIPLQSARPIEIERVLRYIHKESVRRLNKMGQRSKHLQLLIIILPEDTGFYGLIKRVCETELGIVSQCCQPMKARTLNKQYLENLSLKINVKVGGRNTILNDAIQRRIPLVSDRPTIIIGADVTHSQAGEDISPSIAAVVASMDWPEVSKYKGILSAQTPRQEIILDLYKQTHDEKRGVVHSGMIRELFIAFRKSTGQKPHRIIFYRDGVSEGQFSQVLLYEMDALRRACASLEEGYLPPVTFIVVQKRHHTRLFPVDNNTDRSGNIEPGTVVDTKICHPTGFDFYLKSHAGIQGTSRPTHYHVLFDENGFTADQLQTLTNNLCYTYARCTRSVSIVPPAYYAHLAALRARYYIEGHAPDDASVGRGSGGSAAQSQGHLLNVHEFVKDLMFFC